MRTEEEIRLWLDDEAKEYLADCEGPQDALNYIIDDYFANEPDGDRELITRLAKEYLGL